MYFKPSIFYAGMRYGWQRINICVIKQEKIDRNDQEWNLGEIGLPHENAKNKYNSLI